MQQAIFGRVHQGRRFDLNLSGGNPCGSENYALNSHVYLPELARLTRLHGLYPRDTANHLARNDDMAMGVQELDAFYDILLICVQNNVDTVSISRQLLRELQRGLEEDIVLGHV